MSIFRVFWLLMYCHSGYVKSADAFSHMNGSTGVFPNLNQASHILSIESAPTGVAVSIMSGKNLNTSAIHGSSSLTTRSIIRTITSCPSACEIVVPSMHLVYWPPETVMTGLANASITTAPRTMVSDGYTFASPSAYIVYAGMSADHQSCYSGLWSYDLYPNGSYSHASWSNVTWSSSQVGSVHPRVTRAYAPEALSTGGDCYGHSWAAINYTKLYNPEPDYEVATEAACSRQGYHFSKGDVTDSSYLLAGLFLLSAPPDISLVDPLWSTCTAGPVNNYDPPGALTPAIALVPTETANSDPPTPAKPAPSPTHFLPVQTPTSGIDAPGKGEPAMSNSGFDPSKGSADQISSTEKALMPTPDSNTDLDPSDQGQEGGLVAASPQQGVGHENPPTNDPQQDSEPQDGSSSQIPNPAVPGQQSVPTAAEGQPDGGGDSPPNISSPEENFGTQEEGSAAVDTTSDDGPQKVSMVVGTHTILVSASGTSFDGVPLDPEGSPVTVSGAAAMIQGSSIVLGDAIVHLPSPAAENPTLIAGYMVTPFADAVAIDGETLHAGDSPRTIADTLMSLGRNDDLVVNPTIQALPTHPPPSPVGTMVNGQITNIDGQALEVLTNGVSIVGTTLTPGGAAATVSGTPISLGSSALMIDGSTIPVSLATSNIFTTEIGGQIITAAPSSVVIQGTSLEPGGPGVTISNELISLNKAGLLIVGSRTIALGGAGLTTRIGHELITAAPTGAQIAGSTLLPGWAGWTIDGTSVSLNAVGDVIIGGKTIPSSGESIGMGGLILAAFGSKGVAASTSSSSSLSGEPESFQGAGTGRTEAMGIWTAVVVVAMVIFSRNSC